MKAIPLLDPIPAEDVLRDDLRGLVKKSGLGAIANKHKIDRNKLSRWIKEPTDGRPASRLGYADVATYSEVFRSLKGAMLPPWDELRDELRALRDAYDVLTLPILASLMSTAKKTDRYDQRTVGYWLSEDEPNKKAPKPPYSAIANAWNTLAHARYENTGEPYIVADIMLPSEVCHERSGSRDLGRSQVSTPYAPRLVVLDDAPALVSWNRTLWREAKLPVSELTKYRRRDPLDPTSIVIFDTSGVEVGHRERISNALPSIPFDTLARDGRRSAVRAGLWHAVVKNSAFVGVLPPWGYTKSLLMQGKRWAPSGFVYTCPATTCGNQTAYVLGRPGYLSMACKACGEYRSIPPGKFSPRIPQLISLSKSPKSTPNGRHLVKIGSVGRGFVPLRASFETRADAEFVAHELNVQLESDEEQAVVG